jgi:two-component system chemotaxis sensor kinase CheA
VPLEDAAARRPPEPIEGQRRPLGEILVETGASSSADVSSALQQQLEGDERKLGTILLDEGKAAPAAVVEALQSQSAPKRSVADSAIRVDVDLLDGLMNLVGELVLARNQLVRGVGETGDSALVRSAQRLGTITSELQEGIMKTRMQPIGNIWNKFPRVVRDLVVACEKEARVEMEGADTELDKTIIEAIKDPLTHLVRNAIDHGIEKPADRIAGGKSAEGRLLLRAYHEGGQVNIEIIDNGGGIQTERIKQKALERGVITQPDAARMSEREILHLIFTPGFSTAETVSNISGRGVGMDVVRTNIEKLGGTIDVNSKLGPGTTFKIKIPLTLAIIPALIVKMQEAKFAIPQVNLLELVRLEGEQMRNGIEMINGAPVHRLRGKLLPLIYLDKELQLAGSGAPPAKAEHEEGFSRAASDAINIVVLQADDQNFGLVVEEIIDTEEVVVKPLSKQLKNISAFAGATIMGDGKIALILDVLGLADRAGVLSEEARARTTINTQSQQASAEQQSLLLLKAGENRQLAIPLSMVSRLEEIPSTQVEWAGNQELVQYREHLMPLIRLARALGISAYQADEPPELMQVVVCGHNGARIGLVVDEIVDVVEESVALQRNKRQDIVLGVAVIQSKVTELLNVERIIQVADVDFLEDYEPMEAHL